jgi:hypothetical protein
MSRDYHKLAYYYFTESYVNSNELVVECGASLMWFRIR